MPSKPRLEPCYDCTALATLKPIRPKRYDDGRHRCRDCQRERVEKIVRYWCDAAVTYAGLQSTGGRGSYGSRAA